MKRHPSIVHSLMFAALAMLALVQTLAFATPPDLPQATQSGPPCHQGQAKASADHAMPCCDDEAGCAMQDCGVFCHRVAVQFADLPELPRVTVAVVVATVPTLSADAFLILQRIPPLPPPILV